MQSMLDGNVSYREKSRIEVTVFELDGHHPNWDHLGRDPGGKKAMLEIEKVLGRENLQVQRL